MRFVLICASWLSVLLLACESTPHASAATLAVWTRQVTGAVQNPKFYAGLVFFGVDRSPAGGVETDAFDIETGRALWRRSGGLPAVGSTDYLVAGPRVERIDPLTGRSLWRSRALCSHGSESATYVASRKRTTYVGCAGGALFSLRSSTGQVIAVAHPTRVDSYDEMLFLGSGSMSVSGIASGAFLFRQSAILRDGSLAPVAALGRDAHVIGEWSGNAVVYDACCQGTPSDASPGVVRFISLASGREVNAEVLRPYGSVTPTVDRPGAGIMVEDSGKLYLATHSAIFAYRLDDVKQPPQLVWHDLTMLPTLIDRRYLGITYQSRGALETGVLDTENALHIISRQISIPQKMSPTLSLQVVASGKLHDLVLDRGCMVSAHTSASALAVCRNPNVPALNHIAGTSRPLSWGRNNVLLPVSIALYAL